MSKHTQSYKARIVKILLDNPLGVSVYTLRLQLDDIPPGSLRATLAWLNKADYLRVVIRDHLKLYCSTEKTREYADAKGMV